MIDKALKRLRPGAQWSLNGEDYDGLQWLDTEQSIPSLEEVTEEIEKIRDELQKTRYQRQRAPEYPSIGDQLDALFHAGVFPPEMAAKIQAVKDKFPKS